MDRLPVETVVALVLLIAVAPLLARFFRDTWRELDREGLELRRVSVEAGRYDVRALVTCAMAGFSLTVTYYWGNQDAYEKLVRPLLFNLIDPTTLGRYDELIWRFWWSFSRTVPYLLPVALWPLLFRESPLDLGLRVRGFSQHVWIYVACVVVMIPVLTIVSRQASFIDYYPFYELAGRSWTDFLAWELVYVVQFFALELFFRGYWLHGTRALGSSAIMAMAVPYAMIHFEKPFLETSSVLIAATVLGTLAMKTRSIWAGFLVHVTVAVMMDLLALARKQQLPPGLTYLTPVLWTIWGGCLVLLIVLRRAR